MSEYLARLSARRDLLWQLTLRNVKGQRKQSILGAFWVVIQPLGLLAATVFLRAVLLGGGRGYSLEADVTFWDVDSERYDLMIVPGGREPETVRLDAKAVSAVRNFLDAGKPVAAICHASISFSALQSLWQ